MMLYKFKALFTFQIMSNSINTILPVHQVIAKYQHVVYVLKSRRPSLYRLRIDLWPLTTTNKLFQFDIGSLRSLRARNFWRNLFLASLSSYVRHLIANKQLAVVAIPHFFGIL